MKRYVLFVLFSSMALISAACTGAASQYPATTAPIVVTSAPTTDPALPTATIDATSMAATPSGIDSGGGSYTTRDGKLSFEYPQNWFVQESGGQVVISNNQGMLNGGTPLSGQYMVNIVVSPIGEMNVGSADAVQTSLSAREVLVQLAELYQSPNTEISAPFEESVGGSTVYFVRITNASTEGILGVLEMSGTHISLAAVATRGEMSLLEPITRTIGASIQYTP